jgi:iron complex outermembrane recepter protein
MPAEGKKSIIIFGCHPLRSGTTVFAEMKAFCYLIAVFHIFCSVELHAQVYSIKGRVVDENGNPLPGTAVTVIDTHTGAYANSEGEYSVNISETGFYRLRFSFTGYEQVIREVKVPDSAIVNVELKRKLQMTQEIIVSATRAGSGTPVAFTNISGESVRKQNSGQDLPFLLGLTPSLVETSEAGTGVGYTGLRIRGTDGSRINVTVDGIPLNDAESQQVFWVDLPDLAASVDNIQIQRGIGTSSNGSGAFGASINIKTTDPGNKPSAQISSSAGSFNTFRNMAMAETGLLAGSFALQVRYSDIRSDGYIYRTGTDNRSALINAVFSRGRSLLRANVIMGEEHTGISWWGVPSEMVAVDRRYNPAGEYKDTAGNIRYYENESDNYRQNHYRLIYSLDLNQVLFNMAIHYTKGEGYYEEYREDQPYADYGLPDLILGNDTITATDMIRRKWMSNDFYGMVWSAALKKERIDAVVGGGINIYDGDHFGKIIWMRNPGDTEKDYQWYFNEARKGEFSIYGKVSYKLTEKLSGFGDIQYRSVVYDMNGIDDDLRDLTQSHDFHFFNPKAGLFLKISNNQDAYVSIAAAGREPTRSDFKEATGDPGSTPEDETLYDAEAGYNYRSDAVNLGLNLFGMFYSDQLIPTGELSNVGYPIMTNVDKSYRTGIEMTADIKPFNRLEWNISVTASRNKIPGYTGYYIDYNTADWSSVYKSIDMGTVDIAYSPSLTGFSDLSYSLTTYFRMHLVTKYIGKQYFDNTMSRNRMIDQYIVNNLRFDFTRAFRGSGGIDIRFTAANILNSLYESNGYGGLWYEDGKERSWAYYFPQAGINFSLGIDIKF